MGSSVAMIGTDYFTIRRCSNNYQFLRYDTSPVHVVRLRTDSHVLEINWIYCDELVLFTMCYCAFAVATNSFRSLTERDVHPVLIIRAHILYFQYESGE